MILPLHLIAGSLGVGKTTAIRRFVARSPDYTAVIVNDFGETGYDASFIAEAGGADKLRVENVPGGCLCCTSAAQLLPALKMLCARPEVDRIIIEPSGVALLDPLLRLLHEAAPQCGFELAPVIVLFDPAKIRPASLELIPYWRHLVERAGIAVLSRCDLAPPQAVAALQQCLEQWSPPKLRIVQAVHGELPDDLFDLRGSAAIPGQGHTHHADLPPAGTFRSEEIFRLDALQRLLEELAPELARFKGIFRTEAGSCRLEIAGGTVSGSSAPERAFSSADWVGKDSSLAVRIEQCCVGSADRHK